MTLLRIKFFDKLDMPYTDDHTNDNDECCHAPLTDKELEFFEIIPTGLLSEKEQATLHYISGYVASKHDIGIAALEKHFKASEFTDNVSRGKLKHPTACLFQLSMSLFVFYKNVEDNSCSNRLLKAFSIIYESSPCHFNDEDNILRRFINCFAKGYKTQKMNSNSSKNES